MLRLESTHLRKDKEARAYLVMQYLRALLRHRKKVVMEAIIIIIIPSSQAVLDKWLPLQVDLTHRAILARMSDPIF